jgi:hypothetical protein
VSGDARSALDIRRMVAEKVSQCVGGCAQRSGHLSHGGGESESVCRGDARSDLDICRMVAEKVSQRVRGCAQRSGHLSHGGREGESVCRGMRAALWTSVAWWRRK